MGFMKNINLGWKVYFHPSFLAKSKMSVGDALKFYYQNTIVPAIIFIIIGAAMISLGISSYGSTIFGGNAAFLAGIGAVAIVLGLVYFWVLVPISIFINAFIYQLVGYNLLKIFDKNYDRSFAAVMFAELPMMLLYWVVAIPIVGIAALVVLSVWSMVVLIVSLAAQHKVKRTDAVVAILAAMLLVFALTAVIFAFTYIFASAALLSRAGVGAGSFTMPYQ
ncbi:MAG: hypothetical protein M1564_04115 [Candidatus Marsarchaeota archaeon]|jgi:hypothetical protein|nr:hypothetical protein [Candidatus Marsarchaeota archaeon]MCL5431450.1 hypothetical protein [Candidatus Marsarchaeota archaeon]